MRNYQLTVGRIMFKSLLKGLTVKGRILLLSLAILLVCVIAPASPASARSFGTVLSMDANMYRGDYLMSYYGYYQFIFQGDGNLVLYALDPYYGAFACWATNTVGRGGVRVTMQWDGNLVMYGPSNEVIWESNTDQPTGPNDYTYLEMQGDGNAVAYRNRPRPGVPGVAMTSPIWASNTQYCGLY